MLRNQQKIFFKIFSFSTFVLFFLSILTVFFLGVLSVKAEDIKTTGCCMYKDGGKVTGCIDGWEEEKCKNASGIDTEWRKQIVCSDINECLVPPEPITLQIPFVKGESTVKDLGDYINKLYQWLIGALGVLAVVMIMVAGIQWIFAAGSAPKIEEARKKIGNAILGLILCAFSYLILFTINPVLVNLKMPGVTKIRRVLQETTKVKEICKPEKKVPCGEVIFLSDDPKSSNGCIGVYCEQRLGTLPVCSLSFLGGTYKVKDGCIEDFFISVHKESGNELTKCKLSPGASSCGIIIGEWFMGVKCNESIRGQCYVLYAGGKEIVDLAADNKKALYACCNGAPGCEIPVGDCPSGYKKIDSLSAAQAIAFGLSSSNPCEISLRSDKEQMVFCCQNIDNPALLGKFITTTQSWSTIRPPQNLCERPGNELCTNLPEGVNVPCGVGYFDGSICCLGTQCAAGMGSCRQNLLREPAVVYDCLPS